MNDSSYRPDSMNAPPYEDGAGDEETPQFGAVDIVEAFTALRHELRGQTKEHRAVAEQIEAAVSSLQSLESKLLAHVAESRSGGDETEAKALVQVIAEIDQHLSRAVSAIAQWEADRRQRAEASRQALEQFYAGMGRLGRRFARPLMRFIEQQFAMSESPAESPAVEGLNLVLARLRRLMGEQGIERIDTVGQDFDAETMRAIGSVASAEHASGKVAEQFAPAYRWQGRLLRYAEVRVAE